MSQSSRVIVPCYKEEEESALLHPAPHQSGKGQNQSPADAVKGVEKRSEKTILHPKRGAMPVLPAEQHRHSRDGGREVPHILLRRQRWDGHTVHMSVVHQQGSFAGHALSQVGQQGHPVDIKWKEGEGEARSGEIKRSW